MIRNSLLQWRDVTELLIHILGVKDDELRDGVILQTEQLINQREELQVNIQPPYSDDEKTFGQELVELEKKLEVSLEIYLSSIREDIEIQQRKKNSVQAYIDPYNKVFRDGTFYDKKK